jgi:hypothetical protein
LPAELPGLPLRLPVRRPALRLAFAQRFSEVRIHKLWFFTATIMLFQKKLPYCENTHLVSLHAHKCTAAVNLFVERDGSQLASRFTYAAASRLDIIE